MWGLFLFKIIVDFVAQCHYNDIYQVKEDKINGKEVSNAKLTVK